MSVGQKLAMLKVHSSFVTFLSFRNLEAAAEETLKLRRLIWPERIYNPMTAMGFSTMFTFQLDNTKR